MEISNFNSNYDNLNMLNSRQNLMTQNIRLRCILLNKSYYKDLFLKRARSVPELFSLIGRQQVVKVSMQWTWRVKVSVSLENEKL